MKAGSMEALIGANQNMKMMSTPMHVYKQAKSRGDTATMERAMGYVAKFEEKAKKYSEKAAEETKREMEEERREQQIRREEAIRQRKEEAKAMEEKLLEKTGTDSNSDFSERNTD